MNRPIGLFDSGFGGLTVMKEVAKLLPFEDLVYLADTAHLPYGNKSPQKILQFSLENGAFLVEKNIKLLIVACHTACCHALQHLSETLPIPVIGVIQPGLDLIKEFKKVAILGTTSTIESKVYQGLLKAQSPHIQIYAKACPLFVPLIEEGFTHHPSAELIARTYLNDLPHPLDAALLACTHYPLMRSTLQKILGDVVLIEPAAECARQAKAYLAKHNLLNLQIQNPHYQFYATDDPSKFSQFGKVFFGSEISIEKK
jgi:glutamate racemase